MENQERNDYKDYCGWDYCYWKESQTCCYCGKIDGDIKTFELDDDNSNIQQPTQYIYAHHSCFFRNEILRPGRIALAVFVVIALLALLLQFWC